MSYRDKYVYAYMHLHIYIRFIQPIYGQYSHHGRRTEITPLGFSGVLQKVWDGSISQKYVTDKVHEMWGFLW